jgi:hypothetical protein
MDQRFFEILCRGLTLCTDEITNELANGLVPEPERCAIDKCLTGLNHTLLKLREAQAGRVVITDEAFWYNLDDALYALEETHLAGTAEIEWVREAILEWQHRRLAA